MQKRLALARAIALSPKILILDEVFSSQDQELREALLSQLIPLWKEKQTLVFIISHHSVQLKQFVDRQMILENQCLKFM